MMHANTTGINCQWLPGQVLTTACGLEHRPASPLASPTTGVVALCGPKTEPAPPPFVPVSATATAYKPDWIEEERSALSIRSIVKPPHLLRLGLSARLSLDIPDRLGSSLTTQLRSTLRLGSARLPSFVFGTSRRCRACRQSFLRQGWHSASPIRHHRCVKTGPSHSKLAANRRLCQGWRHPHQIRRHRYTSVIAAAHHTHGATKNTAEAAKFAPAIRFGGSPTLLVPRTGGSLVVSRPRLLSVSVSSTASAPASSPDLGFEVATSSYRPAPLAWDPG
jgi:hypothetical protein